MNRPLLKLSVHEIRQESVDVRIFDLRLAGGGDLPPFSAGAHIDIQIDADLMRQYSLLNHQEERFRYVIAVKREPAGRGGSIRMHDQVKPGDSLLASIPRNQFALEEAAIHSVLIAGGIGITPIWSMAQQLAQLGRSWTLHYASRSRQAAALVDALEAFAGAADPTRMSFHFADGTASRLDIRALVDDAPQGTQFYCCGPARLLEAFEAACAGLPASQVHVERFSPVQSAATDGRFTVKLARSGKMIPVIPGQTILDALQSVGVDVAYSCREGVCGQCETSVLAGVPDHRDALLTDAERADGRTMMICCSGSLSDVLTLDL